MANFWGWVSRVTAAAICMATLGVASAQGAAPAITGNGWIAIAVIGGLVLFVVLLISGVMSVSSRSDDDGDTAGFGILEEIDEDDDRRKRKH